MSDQLDLTDKVGVTIPVLHEALQKYAETNEHWPDAIVLRDPAPPIVSNAGKWSTFRGIPIVYRNRSVSHESETDMP